MVDDGPEASVISVPDGPTLAAHEISTLSFTQAFAIYKVPLETGMPYSEGLDSTHRCNWHILFRDARAESCSAVMHEDA